MKSSIIADKLAVQMFTLRDFTNTAEGLSKSLKKISDIGYAAVQMSAVGAMAGDLPEVNAKMARKMLDDYGLSCIATHRPWSRLVDETEKEIELHQEMGCDFLAIGGLPKNYELTHSGFGQFAKDAVPTLTKLSAAGLRFGYHNHSWEFFRPDPGGKTLFDTLLEAAPPQMLFELDLYWVEHSGANCVRVIERCDGRIPIIHLKDKEVIEPGSNETRMAPIGEGNMDWAHIIPVCEDAGVEWYAVEQDNCYRDPFDCLRSSYDYLSTIR
jgi:sugar phosphate isomerase/epimerase